MTNSQVKVEVSPESPELAIEEVVVSMHATHSNPFMQIMKFKGQVGTNSIFALLDSGSTHSFIDPAVIQDQHIQVEETKPMVVMVANGQRMVTNTHYSGITFSLQGHEFSGNLRLLQIQGYDLILELDWLSQFATILVNWEDKWVELDKQGVKIRLQVQEEKATVHV
jgi:Retroviral aspartyl protease